ncbi:HEXXH motif domain-containing protein [Streptomyces griseoluteus]|uniref:HEXXH motif domain-containing protein n=1 Tax=Streptomyces griseoluteus TaxID=29306 RepID=UPI00368CAC43
MSSEPRHALFHMPEPLFAELAPGGGSVEALAFLERGERARRLLLLRTLLGRLHGLRTPLAPPAEAWRTLKEAALHAPEAVDRLLLAPSTGGWIAHMLRRVHGTASGPELWVEAGHLCSLAVTASLYAGTGTDLLVPLTDGALCLPGLGMARLPDAGPGVTVGRACVECGELTLTAPAEHPGPRPLTVRPHTAPARAPRTPSPAPAASAPDDSALDDSVPEESGRFWLPLRTLAAFADAGPGTVLLDDLDPYRGLDDPLPPARLDHAEAEAWQELFERAVALTGPPQGAVPGRLDPAAIRAVVPWGRTRAPATAPPTVQVSATSGDSYAAMLIARPSSPVALAETLVHEFQHSKLAALLHLFPLLDDDREERYYAPWRADPRHLTGLLHGAYAFTGVAGFWRDLTADPEHAGTAAYHFALRRLQCRLVVRTLLASGRLTASGHALVTGLARVLDGWLREPVDPPALARARTAAVLHRTEWRLRNVAPTPHGTHPDAPATGAPDDPRLRPDRAPWPDVRTYAFATPSPAPCGADEHLAAGDPAAALERYADELASDPAEPHALAGWIVARSLLDPGRATRRMLARPELVQPLPSPPTP